MPTIQIKHRNGRVAFIASPYIHRHTDAMPNHVCVDVRGNGASRKNYDLEYWRKDDIQTGE